MQSTEKILLEFDPESNELLPALKKISASFGYVNKKDARKIASYFSIPRSKVFETASFYDLVSVRPSAGLTMQVCSSTNCVVSGAFAVIKEIESFFNIKVGDKNNPNVSLEEVSCLGRCGEGPIVVINGQVHTNVTASSIHGILEKYLKN